MRRPETREQYQLRRRLEHEHELLNPTWRPKALFAEYPARCSACGALLQCSNCQRRPRKLQFLEGRHLQDRLGCDCSREGIVRVSCTRCDHSYRQITYAA